ncbi:uncharacterized protein LOC108435459 isoform X2 [Pygocentrus nattereri]|uniref:uncharacterized protein LOC108435459 isoform X2 n=1 Tax=Pygocentrus nattereri TaxID=42514 RepID=UPI0008143E14|nr:uncharacterized protein LOC108435459 isoform X2 [Pygocentrus nattereri]
MCLQQRLAVQLTRLDSGEQGSFLLLLLRQQSRAVEQRNPPSYETQRRLQCLSDYTRRHFTEALPSVPASPNPSVASPDPPFCPTPPAHSGTNLEESLYVSSSPSTPTRHEKDTEVPLAGLSSPHLDCEDYEEPEGEMVTPLTMTPEPPATPRTLSSLSDFSRPASSQFSFRTDLSSTLSSAHSVNLSDADTDNDGDVGDKGNDENSNDLEACSSSLSELRFSSFIGSALASCTPPISPECSFSRPLTSHSPETSSTCFPDISKYDHIIHGPNPPLRQASIDKASSPTTRMAPASPVEACSDWSTFHWPVLPPIASQRGDTETGASLSSPFSRSESDMFAELEAVAPRTGSCLSRDHPDCSDTDPTSPTTDVSPGLAALTVGCDSGDLGSLSRVQLLLLERRASEEEPESPLRLDWSSPLGQRAHHEAGLQVWSVGIPQHYQSTETYTPVSWIERNMSPRLVPVGGEGSQTGSPVHTYAEDISRSSSPWSPSSSVGTDSCVSRQSDTSEKKGWEESQGSDLVCQSPLGLSAEPAESKEDPAAAVMEATAQKMACPARREIPWTGRRGRNQLKDRRRRRQRKELGEKGEERKTKALQIYSKLQEGNEAAQPSKSSSCSRFEDFDFLAKYCIINPEKLTVYKSAFEAVDSDGDGYLSCFQVLLALKEVIPPELLTEEEEIYVYRILELVDFRVTEGLTDLRLFAVVAGLAQKIATLDDFMRSLISKMDFKSLEMKLYKAKQLFLFLLEGQAGGTVTTQGCISAEQLLVELKAGGIRQEHEEAVRRELRSLRSLDLLDFLAHLPLFILIHNSVIANPLDDSSNL